MLQINEQDWHDNIGFLCGFCIVNHVQVRVQAASRAVTVAKLMSWQIRASQKATP